MRKVGRRGKLGQIGERGVRWQGGTCRGKSRGRRVEKVGERCEVARWERWVTRVRLLRLGGESGWCLY